MTQTQQPEALRLAEQCDNFDKRAPIAACLRAQHARIQELELNLTHRQEVYTASLEQIVCLQDRIAELEQGKCLHQIAEPAASMKQIEEVMELVLGWQIKNDIAGDAAIDAFDPECSAEDDAFANKCHEEKLEAWEAIRSKLRTLLSTPQPCSRSHPHEEMTPMCELRTEIARLTNALARSEAQLAAAPQAVPGVGALYALQEAEAALELAIHRILKRDPGHAVHVTSEAKALVAVRAALDTAAPAYPAEGEVQ